MTGKRRWMLTAYALCAAILLTGGRSAGGPVSDADAILHAADMRAGLCVHVGCGDGALATELARRGTMLVHGVCLDPNAVPEARRRLERLGVYGQVSVETARPGILPHADGIVDLAVVDGRARVFQVGPGRDEVLRVLRPGGAAVLWQAGRVGGVVRKPRPQGMDDWTHRAYDASGNCVSADTAIGPLASLRWIAGPAWPMGTGYQVSNGGSVAARGRVFCVTLNEASNAGRIPQIRDDTWFLTARNAHNGLLLWSRPIGRNKRRDGQEFADYLLAGRQRVYAVIGESLLGLDPATGQTLRTYHKGVALGGRAALHGGTLVLAQPRSIRAFDAETGEARWQHDGEALDMLIGPSEVLFATAGRAKLVCLGLDQGTERWRADLGDINGRKKQLLFLAGGVAVLVWERDWQKGANGIAAFSTADGRRLWRTEYDSARAIWANTVWFVDGLVWHREGKAGMVGRAPNTGTPVRRFALQGGYSGGCVRNIATRQYLISTRPPNFLAWEDGRAYPFRGGRHGCRAGVIVANGLLYSQPHGCKCVTESVRGFVAFGSAQTPPAESTPRLQLGPAFGATGDRESGIGNRDWPTFRHDARRTGATISQLLPHRKRLWQTKLDDQKPPPSPLAEEWLSHPLGPDRLTAPVVSGGSVYMALRDAHRLVCLDARTGTVRWAFTAGGRIDVPPTIHDGLCLLGCYDGHVYCLRAADGALVWRFRASSVDQRIVAHGQIESVSPVIGGVLVHRNVAYCIAGRTSAADGGLLGHALRPETGEVVWSRPLAAACSDLLVVEGGALRLAGGASAGARFDPNTGEPMRKIARPGFRWDYAGKIRSLWGGPNRVLDRSWHVLSINDTASHWMRIKQGYGSHQGQLLVSAPGGGRVFGFRFRYIHWSKVKDPNTEFGGEIVAWEAGKETWKLDVPRTFQPEALCLAGRTLLAAGPTDRFRRTPGGKLWALSTEDGKLLEEHLLDSPPAADGLAVADGRLYLTTSDGHVACYGP